MGMHTSDQACDRAHEIVARAMAAGADAADAVFAADTALDVSVRLGALEDVGRSESAELGLRVFVGPRNASVSTSDLSAASIDTLVERAIAMAREGARVLLTDINGEGAAAQAEADQARRNSDEAYKIELARIEATKQAKIKADNEVRANRDKPAGDTGAAGGGGSIVNTRPSQQQPQVTQPTIDLRGATLIGLDMQAGQDALVRLLTPAFKRLGNLTR